MSEWDAAGFCVSKFSLVWRLREDVLPVQSVHMKGTDLATQRELEEEFKDIDRRKKKRWGIAIVLGIGLMMVQPLLNDASAGYGPLADGSSQSSVVMWLIFIGLGYVFWVFYANWKDTKRQKDIGATILRITHSEDRG